MADTTKTLREALLRALDSTMDFRHTPEGMVRGGGFINKQLTADAICAALCDWTLATLPQAEPVTAPRKLIGWRTENFLHETADRNVAANWEPNIGVLPIFSDDPDTRLPKPSNDY